MSEIQVSMVSGNFEEKLKWRPEVTETIGMREIKPARAQARDRSYCICFILAGRESWAREIRSFLENNLKLVYK